MRGSRLTGYRRGSETSGGYPCRLGNRCIFISINIYIESKTERQAKCIHIYTSTYIHIYVYTYICTYAYRLAAGWHIFSLDHLSILPLLHVQFLHPILDELLVAHAHYLYKYTHKANVLPNRESATHCNPLQPAATRCNPLQPTATHCNPLQPTATHCNTLQYTATHCNTLQHIATHCNTATQRIIIAYRVQFPNRMSDKYAAQ